MFNYPFIGGILLGLALAFFLGPAFFALLQTSITRGFRSGFFLALGISASDFTIIAVCYLGLSNVITGSDQNSFILGIIGGIILIIFGVYTFFKKPVLQSNKTNNNNKLDKMPGPFTYIFKGYFLNLFNPFILFWWVTIVMGIIGDYNGDRFSVISFFAGTIGTVFGTDLLKAFVANKIKEKLKYNFLLWMNRAVGILLAAFGIVLIFKVFFDIQLP